MESTGHEDACLSKENAEPIIRGLETENETHKEDDDLGVLASGIDDDDELPSLDDVFKRAGMEMTKSKSAKRRQRRKRAQNRCQSLQPEDGDATASTEHERTIRDGDQLHNKPVPEYAPHAKGKKKKKRQKRHKQSSGASGGKSSAAAAFTNEDGWKNEHELRRDALKRRLRDRINGSREARSALHVQQRLDEERSDDETPSDMLEQVLGENGNGGDENGTAGTEEDADLASTISQLGRRKLGRMKRKGKITSASIQRAMGSKHMNAGTVKAMTNQ